MNDVSAGEYCQSIHFWDFNNRSIEKTVDLGEEGLIPLEVRFHNNPESMHGFCTVALSSNVFHWHKCLWDVEMEKVIGMTFLAIDVDTFPVPISAHHEHSSVNG